MIILKTILTLYRLEIQSFMKFSTQDSSGNDIFIRRRFSKPNIVFWRNLMYFTLLCCKFKAILFFVIYALHHVTVVFDIYVSAVLYVSYMFIWTCATYLRLLLCNFFYQTDNHELHQGYLQEYVNNYWSFRVTEHVMYLVEGEVVVKRMSSCYSWPC